MSSLNTDLIFPLSGETVFCPNAVATTITVSNVGICYLTGLFTSYNNDSITVSLNGKAVIFASGFYGTGVANLLSFDNVIANSTATKTINGIPVCASDKNNGCYLPVKKDDIIIVTPNNCYAIVSLLYLT